MECFETIRGRIRTILGQGQDLDIKVTGLACLGTVGYRPSALGRPETHSAEIGQWLSNCRSALH